MDKKAGIGVIGCGNVGGSFIKHFNKKRTLLKKKTGIDFSILGIADKDRSKKSVYGKIFTQNPEELLQNDDIDIIVELIGGTSPAFTLIKKALKKGKSVVTANKALLSEKSSELFELAAKHHGHIGFEASVASAIPAIKSLKESFIGNDILRFMAILNGTTNYILTQMSLCGGNFSQALAQAQRLGYAEANPTLDIEGIDTAHKLAILSSIAFNRNIHWKDIPTEGIKKIDPSDIEFAEIFGYRLKLLAIAKKEKNNVELRVNPTFLPASHILSNVEGVYNAVYMEGDIAGKSLMFGEGAGGNAAASAAIADVVDIGEKITGKANLSSSTLYQNNKLKLTPVSEIHTRYYLRFTVPDKPGILAAITKILGDNNISIASVLQKEENRNYAVPVVILTHRAKEKDIQKSIKKIDSLSVVKAPTIIIRVEN